MWYVYNREDTWQCGWAVASEKEAVKACKADAELTYRYVG